MRKRRGTRQGEAGTIGRSERTSSPTAPSDSERRVPGVGKVDKSGYLAETGTEAVSVAMGGEAWFKQGHLETVLWSYGEDDAVDTVRHGLRVEQVEQIGVRYAKLMYETDPDSSSGAGYLFDKALAVAAVEVIEGEPRSLARKRRRSMT